MANATCTLSGNRVLHSVLITRPPSDKGCSQPVLEDIASSQLTVVATYSAGGLAKDRGYPLLHALGTMLLKERPKIGIVRGLAVGKGSRCSTSSSAPFAHWRASGSAHCIEGPNVGAREAHTVWAFCHDFYYHLPRAALFVQDDPALHTIRRDLVDRTGWAAALEQSFAQRKSMPFAAARRTPWVPSPCACSPVREPFSLGGYGGYRPLHWWLTSFLAPFANGSLSQGWPNELRWPAMAQFLVPRGAIRARSRHFHALNTRLTEVPAPLKANVPRRPGSSDDFHKKTAKWANFGPMVVDLGPPPPRSVPAADRRPGINGMDFAQLYERSWFQAFDPALPEARPVHLQCFERSAIQRGPMRCAGAACPYSPLPGGCAATDELGRTTPPADWAFAPSKSDSGTRRCLGAGCLVAAEVGSAAWAAR